jgi:hypothetical protein
MGAKLVAYRHVPSGFEMVIGEPDIETGRVWSLWFNTRLSDDPEAWDEEIGFVNELQKRLGELSTDHRLIRAQMAEFCRVHPLFPRSIDVLCEEIGRGRFSVPTSMGCEGRGLLRALGYRAPQSMNKERKDMLSGYVQSLRKWLGPGDPEGSIESKVFGFLEQPTGVKKRLVERLLSAIDHETASVSDLKGVSEGLCKETQSESILVDAGRPLNCFGCDACSEGESGPVCGCCHGMLIDSVLLCVGSPGEGGSVFKKYGRFIQENILAYLLAVNSWLLQKPAEPVTSVTTARYIGDDAARRLAFRVHSSLGEKDRVKEWLAACLLKTVKDNQRWHKRAELADSFPQATSWLSEHRTEMSS